MLRNNEFHNIKVYSFSRLFDLRLVPAIWSCLLDFQRLFSEVGINFILDHKVKKLKDVKEILGKEGPERVVFLVTNVFDALILFVYSVLLFKKLLVIFWVQGVVNYESYMKRRSKIRWLVL